MQSSPEPVNGFAADKKCLAWQPDDLHVRKDLDPSARDSEGRVPDNASASGIQSWSMVEFETLSSPPLSAPKPVQGTPSWMPVEFDLNSLHKQAGTWNRSKGDRDQMDGIITNAMQRAEEIRSEAEMKASLILHEAEAQAAQKLEEAQNQAAQILRQAYQEGHQSANAETRELLQTAVSIVDEVRTWRDETLANSEMTMLRLVIEIAQTIFGDGLPLDPDTLGQTFSRAIENARSLGNLRIYAHPEDVSQLSPSWPRQQAALSGQRLELVPSDIIKRGGCFVEGEFGSVDARVESQFEHIKNTLFGVATDVEESALR